MNNHEKLDCGTVKEIRPLSSYEFDSISVDDLGKTLARSANYTIRLPKDKYGNTICVGDTVITHFDQREVIAVDGKDKVLCYFGNTIGFCLANECVLVEHDTQEKLDADAQSIADEWCNQSCDTSGSKQCLHNGIQDLLRRQRELDGKNNG